MKVAECSACKDISECVARGSEFITSQACTSRAHRILLSGRTWSYRRDPGHCCSGGTGRFEQSSSFLCDKASVELICRFAAKPT
eukprot:2512516-Rhodomonas_salina.2